MKKILQGCRAGTVTVITVCCPLLTKVPKGMSVFLFETGDTWDWERIRE